MATASTDKIDLYKQFKTEYAAKKGKPAIVTTSAAPYLIVKGTSAPGSEQFESRVGGLYGMAYTLKFMHKAQGKDFAVCKLEGLYGVDGQEPRDLASLPKDEWNWRLMIRVPDFVKKKDLDAARTQLKEKGKDGDFDAVELETINEGTCVQTLHVGSYCNEFESIQQMHEFAKEEGYTPHGWHHEIYLSDPRRVAEDKLKTVLRHPVKK